MHTTSSAFLDALTEVGVSYIFANFGSDHPALIETIAEARATGRPTPKVIICPNEMAGLSAAHGFWQVSGVAQAVLVHVECGTQALAGAVHNAAKGRAPVLIFAGASPITQHGELKGSRNEFIQWVQDVHDPRGLVRGYMNYETEIRTGRNVKELVYRAMQFAYSDPKGPVYLMGAREVMEEAVPLSANDVSAWRPVEPPSASGKSGGGDRHRAHRRAPTARRDLILRSQSGGRCAPRGLLPPLGYRRAGLRARRRQFSARQSALSGRSMERTAPESGAGRG